MMDDYFLQGFRNLFFSPRFWSPCSECAFFVSDCGVEFASCSVFQDVALVISRFDCPNFISCESLERSYAGDET